MLSVSILILQLHATSAPVMFQLAVWFDTRLLSMVFGKKGGLLLVAVQRVKIVFGVSHRTEINASADYYSLVLATVALINHPLQRPNLSVLFVTTSIPRFQNSVHTLELSTLMIFNIFAKFVARFSGVK